MEAALLTLPGIRTAAVTAPVDALGGTQLVAYVVADGDPPPSASTLRARLAVDLPDPLIPTAFVYLDTMPLTAGGKVDRRALPAPGRTRPVLDVPFVAPSTPLEELLSRIWAEVLHLDRVGVRDDFLDLGGDSLRASQVVTRVQSVLPVPIPPTVLFTAPTVEAMAFAVLACLGDPAV